MELIDLLKQLKNIEADPEYTLKSRMDILASPRGLHGKNRFSFWQFLSQGLEIGPTIVLTALLVFMVIGGFSFLNLISPKEKTGVDVAGIRAEAQAIDIQIQLTDLTYSDVIETKTPQSTAPTANSRNLTQEDKNRLKEQAEKIGIKNIPSLNSEGASPQNEPTLDETLQKLGE